MDFYTQAELAEFLRLHPATLARWRLTNKGPAWIEVGGQFRYSKETVDAWLEANTKGTANGA